MQEKKTFSYDYLSKYRNVLMGLQIILIIVFHFAEDAYYERDSRIIELYWKYIRSSGVDMFLLLSGIGLFFSWKRRAEAKPFYIKRFTRVLIPYFLIAVPAWIWFDFIYAERGVIRFFQDLFFVTLFTDGTKRFWYIFIALFSYLIFPYIFEVVETAADRISAQMRILLLCAVCTLLAVLLQIYYNELYKYLSIVLTRIPPFLVGVLIGKAVYEKRKVPVSKIWIMVLVAVIIAWPLQMVTKKIIGVYSLAFLNYSLSLVFVLMLVILSGLKNGFANSIHEFLVKSLGWFGKYTLELYLIHVGLRRVMNQIGYPTWRISNELILIVLSVILSIVVSKLAGLVQHMVLSKWITVK